MTLMPPEGTPPVEVRYTSEFKRNVRRLLKRYRQIRNDIQPVIDQLEQGETPGDQMTETGYAVFKARAKNTDARKGKSGGYRVIYYLRTAERVILVTVYSKLEQGDISSGAIRRIIAEYEQSK